MLQIRKEQIDALEAAMLVDFENFMVEHLTEHFAPEIQGKSEAEIREFIREGIKRAKAYGVDLQSAYGQFINLMVMFGSDFDTEPAYPWAAEILRDASIRDPNDRIDQLTYVASQYLDETAPDETDSLE